MIYNILRLFICCVACISCTSKRYIPVSQTHSELSIQTAHDTIFQDRVLTKIVKEATIENIRQYDSTSVIVDNDGNVKRIDNWHQTIVERNTQTASELRDSVSFYKSLCEYLLTQRSDSIEKPVFFPKKTSILDRLKIHFAKIAGIVIIGIIGYAIWRIHRRK